MSYAEAEAGAVRHGFTRAQIMKAWTPWAILSVLVFLWGLPQIKDLLNALSAPKFPIDGLHNLVVRMPPVVPKPTPEAAVYVLNWLSATGHRHPDRRDHRRPGDGASRSRRWCRPTARR